MILRVIKRVIAELKQEVEFNRDMRRLVRSQLDYGALQKMIDNVSLNNVEIEVKMADKTVLIRPSNKQQALPTFYERYKTAHNY